MKKTTMTRYTVRLTDAQIAKLKKIKNASKLIRAFIDTLEVDDENSKSG